MGDFLGGTALPVLSLYIGMVLDDVSSNLVNPTYHFDGLSWIGSRVLIHFNSALDLNKFLFLRSL